MKKKHYLTVEVLKLNVTDQVLELGTRGILVALGVLIPGVVAGWFLAEFLAGYLKFAIDIRLLSASLLALLSGWLMFLIWHVRRMKSMTRLLSWVMGVGVVMGMLAFGSVY
jgi:hypothetical protein